MRLSPDGRHARPARILTPVIALQLLACAPAGSPPAPAALTLQRPVGRRAYVFTSRQTTPAGTTRVRVTFTLVSTAANETAEITAFERASGDGAFAAATISADCARRLAAPAGTVVVLPITPPPHQLSGLVPDCVPEDLFGAASDILPLLMIQAQPRFRARELQAVGEALRFDGYATGWRLPPSLLDARVVADSGVVSLDSVTASRAVIGWNTSPMQVDLLRQLAPGRRALLSGREWFWARIVVDPRSGTLLEGRTVVDSLALRMTVPYPDSTLHVAGDRSPSGSGLPVVVTRALELRLLPEGVKP
jgi:hypothetical protein